jgi:hypothetical protein
MHYIRSITAPEKISATTGASIRYAGFGAFFQDFESFTEGKNGVPGRI